jgi:hypothetical protein
LNWPEGDRLACIVVVWAWERIARSVVLLLAQEKAVVNCFFG